LRVSVKTIAIMQPTYLPWLGYFDLMAQSDIFVFLDSVQFDKRSWQQRNRIKSPSGELLLTVPVLTKQRRTQKICEVEIQPDSDFGDKHIKTIQYNYSKAPFFSRYLGGLAAILEKRHGYLAELTIELIDWLREAIGIKTELIRSSSLGIQGNKVELLVAICKSVGAERYLSPPGSRGYIEENDLFADNGIELCYHEYHHPRYRQLFGDFVPYLSALDLLLNEGDNSLSIIRFGQGGTVMANRKTPTYLGTALKQTPEKSKFPPAEAP